MRINAKPSKAILGKRERLFIIVSAQYAVLFLAGLACAAAIYLILGSSNALLSASNAASLLAAGLSITYLLMHQCGAWRYSLGGIELPMKKKNALLSWSRIANIVSIPIWTAASILGLFVTFSSPSCGRDSADDADWRAGSLNDCNIQRASIAVNLAAAIFSVVLFCMLATVERPFAASLAGVHLRDHHEEEMLHLSAADWPSPSPPRGRAPRCSYDTSIYAPSFQAATPRQENWLPKLSFDTPTDRDHPVRRASRNDIQSLRHKESDLLPSPAVLQYSQGSSPRHSMRGRPAFKRSATVTSSIYSQSTTAESTYSKRASSVSSLSDDSSFFSPLKSPPPLARTFSCSPAVPSIPEQYLTESTTDDICTPEGPIQPRSQPRLPSTQFWKFEHYDTSRNHYPIDENTPVSFPRKHIRRHTELSLDRISPQPEGTVIRSDLNRSNTTTIGGRVGKWTYENFRKGRSVDASARNLWVLPPRLDGSEVEAASPSLGKGGRARAERRRSRTLVKKRQPGDIVARKDVENVRTL